MAQKSGIGGQGLGWLVAAILALLLVAKCGNTGTTPAPAASATVSTSIPRYVAARSLRCRSAPAATGGVTASLRRDERVTVIKTEGDWSQLGQPGGACWVATSYLAEAPSQIAGNATTAQPQGLLRANRTASLATAGATAAGVGAAYTAQRAYKRNASAHRTRPVRTRARSSRHAYRAPRHSSYSHGDNCPCSGRSICIGPRGGRYCITSGGNKRYGV